MSPPQAVLDRLRKRGYTTGEDGWSRIIHPDDPNDPGWFCYAKKGSRTFAITVCMVTGKAIVEVLAHHSYIGVILPPLLSKEEEEGARELRRALLGCEGCDDSGIRPDSTPHGGPLPTGFVAVERCDSCMKYDSDIAAALAWGGTEIQERPADTICRPPESFLAAPRSR